MMASAMAAALVFGASAMAAFGDGAPDLGALAREDYAHAVRPGGVGGSPFWNIYARMFMYPPAFDFSKGGRQEAKVTVLELRVRSSLSSVEAVL